MKSLEQYQPLLTSYTEGLGAVAGASIQLAGGVLQGKANDEYNDMVRAENEKNRQFANQEATNSYLRQKHLMKMQMEYDTAANQRKRLEAAGLNPYLMMDGGDAGSVSSQSAPQANQPSSLPYQAQRYEWLQNMAMQSAQIANINADTEAKKKQGYLFDSQGNWFESSAEGQRIRNDADDLYLEKLMEADLNKTDAETAYIDGKRINESIASILSQRNFDIMTPLVAGNTVADTIVKQMKAENVDINSKQGRITLAWLGAMYASQYAFQQVQTRLGQQQVNFNNATYNSRVDSVRYSAMIDRYNLHMSRNEAVKSYHNLPADLNAAAYRTRETELYLDTFDAFEESFRLKIYSQPGVSYDKMGIRNWFYKIGYIALPMVAGSLAPFVGASGSFMSGLGAMNRPAPQSTHYHSAPTYNTINNR